MPQLMTPDNMNLPSGLWTTIGPPLSPWNIKFKLGGNIHRWRMFWQARIAAHIDIIAVLHLTDQLTMVTMALAITKKFYYNWPRNCPFHQLHSQRRWKCRECVQRNRHLGTSSHRLCCWSQEGQPLASLKVEVHLKFLRIFSSGFFKQILGATNIFMMYWMIFQGPWLSNGRASGPSLYELAVIVTMKQDLTDAV